MRDHCRGGGAVVAAAVAVIEQQAQNGSLPFSNTSASETARDSLSRSKQVRSPSNCNQSQRETDSLTNNDVEESLQRRDNSKNQKELAFVAELPYAFIYVGENAEGMEILADEETESRVNFSGMGVRRNETRKSHSPTNLHAVSKNTLCLEEVAPGGNSQFTVKNPLDYIDRIALGKADFGTCLTRSNLDFHRGKSANPPKNWSTEVVKVNQSNQKIESADHNFEKAVDDFNVTAEDVQNFVSKYNSLKRSRNSSTTEGHQETIVLRNQYVQEEKGNKLSTTDFSVSTSDDFGTDSSEDDSSSNTESDSGREHVINEGLETITEEDRATASSVNSNSTRGGDSSSPDDDSTVKGNAAWSGTTSNRESTSDLSTCSSDRPKSLKDSSTRCNDDFQWIRKEPIEISSPKMEEQLPQSKPPINRSVRDKTPRRSSERSAPGSLDRRRHHHQNRAERDQKSRSTHILKSPPRFDDYGTQNCQNWCCNPHANEQFCFDNFHRRHERIDPQRYGSSPMLMEQRFADRGSHPDLYSDFNRFRHEQPYGCCSYHSAPPCCFFGDGRNFHWTPPSYPVNKGADHDEKIRKLQTEKDNLQLQVQVLTEQIEAQTDKISDLEKTLTERKHQLGNSEDMLQREMLSRSSLETQKLELMSTISEMKLHQAALERENLELKSSRFNNNTTSIGGVTKPPLRPRASPQLQHSTPVHHSSSQGLNMRMSPSPSPVPTGSIITHSPRKIESHSQEVVQPPKTPPANYRRQIDIHYGSLPRQQFISNGELVPVTDSNANPANGSRKGVAFAETEKIIIEDTSDGSPQSPSLQFNKNKGIKKIFGRMKRSGSGNLEDIPGLAEFQRGGVRATAAARLGWSEPQITAKPDKPFAEWDTENICDWLQDLGLEQYIPEAKRWIKNGQQLQEASIQEIEKELAIKNSLHRKKLQLAIIDTQENSCSDQFLAKAGKLDTAWVLRWLDDTGLPQHKEAFLVNRVDGRVLHRLTIDDLAILHVTSLLHVASLKRGIQVLRENDFEPGCLQRRSLPDDPESPTSKLICLWTTHRVMEWLRAVDLAEYAPNLRGAGVHGGLMVLEDKFTSELLASILNIPPGKTLLRRHLNTHFKELLGKEIIQEKRESEGTLGYIPLTPSAKLKVAKKSQFSLKRKKSKGEVDYGDLVCPLNPNSEGEMNGSVRSSVGMTRVEEVKEEAAFLLTDDSSLTGSYPQSPSVSPLPDRHHQM